MSTSVNQVLQEVQTGHGLSLAAAARMLPGVGNGHANPSTLFRWATDGVKLPDGRRLKLEAVRIGRRLVTSGQAIERFVIASTDGHGGDIAQPRTPAQRRHAAADAERELDAFGV